MEKILTYFLLLIGYISSVFSIKMRKSFGVFAGNIMMKLSLSRKQVTYNNLKEAFPEKSHDWIESTVKEAYHNLGIVMMEFLVLKHLTEVDLRSYVEYENIELINEIYKRGNGLILLSGHFGNWEYLAYTAGLFTKIPILIVVKPQKNEYADRIINKYRTRSGNKVVSMFSAARQIVKTLTNGEAIALLADQSATSDKDLFIDFFGRPAATYEAPAALALKFNVPIIYGFAVRKDNGTYYIKLYELKFDDLENNPEGIRILTERHTKALEKAIRDNPGLWAWQHKRWKYQPSQ